LSPCVDSFLRCWHTTPPPRNANGSRGSLRAGRFSFLIDDGAYKDPRGVIPLLALLLVLLATLLTALLLVFVLLFLLVGMATMAALLILASALAALLATLVTTLTLLLLILVVCLVLIVCHWEYSYVDDRPTEQH
jgi:hypothetical protein